MHTRRDHRATGSVAGRKVARRDFGHDPATAVVCEDRVDEADRTDRHQDVTDNVQIDPADSRIDREGKNGPDGDQEK